MPEHPTDKDTKSISDYNYQSAKVLIVDNDAAIRQILMTGLSKSGYHCYEAEDGLAALNILDRNDIDIVVSDIKMPKMDGLELTKIVNEKYRSDVILITGFSEEFFYEEIIELGASDFLEKPIRLEELNVRMKRVLRERKATRQQREITKQLQENERIFRKTFEAIPVPAYLWEKGANGSILLKSFNRAGYEASHGDIVDAVGTALEVYHSHQPEIISQIKYAMESGDSYHEEKRYRSRTTGKEYWLDINYSTPFENCVLVVSPDITEQKKSEEELRRLSYEDGLTGVANRRFFEEIIHREWKRSARNDTHLSLIMTDIDYFKAYNDTFGHVEGDECLKKVAGALRDTLKRPADMIARYGGEEFVIILPDTDQTGAMCVAESQRANVEALGLEHPKSKKYKVITLSLGVATMTPQPNSTPTQLISIADQALYRAKNNGRNRTHFLTTASD